MGYQSILRLVRELSSGGKSHAQVIGYKTYKGPVKEDTSKASIVYECKHCGYRYPFTPRQCGRCGNTQFYMEVI
jgi:rubrerythrin